MVSPASRQRATDPGQPGWVAALAAGREPIWTPIACGLLALAGWLGPGAIGLPRPASLAAFAAAYLAGGSLSFVRALRSLARRRLDIDLLMLLSAAGAAAIGEFVEGATLLFLFSLSNSLEARALARTTRAIEALMELRPDEATRLDAAGAEERVAVEALRPGDLLRVRPGERLPADGVVASGTTAADQAAITGESVPVEKGPGDAVYAGSINVGGTVEVRVSRSAGESTLSRIIRLVEEARETKAPTQHFIDRFEQGYAAAVIFSAAVAIFAPLIFGAPFHPTFYRAMTLLVVASPCALVISTPATILAALAHAARRGMLFKGGAPLEALAGIEVVAFDKTGTLTAGHPTVTRVVPFGGTDADRLLAVAAAVESLSEHHLGHAIVEAAKLRGLVLPTASGLRNQRGQGVVAAVAGRPVAVGRREFVATAAGGAPEGTAGADAAAAEALARAGATVVYVAGGGIAGAIAIDDPVRPGAAEAVAALRAQGVARTLLLTGDGPAVAARVAAAVGVDEWRAELLPEDKVTVLRELATAGSSIAMVGDGVNDAPALATATVGVAMGIAGTDAALETADLVLVKDDLGQLAYAVRLARRARRVVRQNLAFASAVIAVLVIVNLTHGLELPVGVVGHEGSTILVVLNGLRLLRPLRGAAAPVA
jgi:Zn2+/Cd2+-exporting ATPase